LVHRGPDSAGVMTEGSVGLAMRRLSIIDLEGGDQPIGNEDGTVTVVHNGEIYNYRELRRELERRGHRFRTRSDTEVLVHLYEEHGTGFAERLRGMFGLAIWDAPRRRLVLARDRFGIKPLFYRHVGETLSFASELKALLRQPGFSRDIDSDAVEAYLALNWIPAPLTIFREARKLPAGNVLVAENGALRLERYARPAPAARVQLRSESFKALADELRDRLRDSIRAHMVADVPVGVLLSGGVDSTIICALAAEEAGTALKTFSIGFTDKTFDELDRAQLVARRYGTDHHDLVVEPDAVDLLPKVVDAFDEPFADSSALPTYLVSQLAAGEVKVALAGEGGDELFGGYFTYAADRIAPLVGPIAAPLKPLIDRLPSSSKASRLDDKAKRFAEGARMRPLERHVSWGEVFSEEMRRDLLEPARERGRDPLELYRARYGETEGADRLSRLLDVDLGINLVDDQLTKTDRSSMAHSLEIRVPLLDTAVSDLALSVGSHHHVRGLAKKRLLRAAGAPLIPDEVLNARKQGFSIPAARWLREELQPFAREVLSPASLRSQGIFRPAAVEALFDTHVSRRADRSRQLWSLLVFTLWHGRMAGAGTASAGGRSAAA
ncbi:MAG: asparagine synthase (glutamine-hydrolyzing), partial [Actinomycetota bacterium]|nr:asparagine synthase (glutamine-hydrolyzing) [Actinomycetota bacterium]